MAGVETRIRAHRLSQEFARRFPAVPDLEFERVGAVVGLEHEFEVLSRAGKVDFRHLVGSVDPDGRCLDPGDPLARRRAWGGVLTADGPEAEIALPPLAGVCGVASYAAGVAEAARADLAGSIPAGMRLAGYSTHLSVSMPTSTAVRLVDRYARTFAVVMMLLLDSGESPGLLVRARPGRLELGGDYVDGWRLEAALAFALASAAVLAQQPREPGVPVLAARTVETPLRRGRFVAGDAFGQDVYASGRSTMLARRRGGSIRAQDVLELAWQAVRGHGSLGAPDRMLLDRLVYGAVPLASDAGGAAGANLPELPPPPNLAAFHALPAARARNGIGFEPVVQTWHALVLRATTPTRQAIVTVPGSRIASFTALLDHGELDDVLASYLELQDGSRVLASAQQTRAPGLFDRLGDRGKLLLAEPGQRRARIGSGGGGGPGDRSKEHRPAPRGSRRGLWAAAAAAAAVVVVVAGVAIAAGGSEDDEQPKAGPVVSPTVATQPSTTTEPSTAPSSAEPPVVEPGTGRGTVVAEQDGQFTTQLTMTLSDALVSPGDVVEMKVSGRSVGPNWVRFVDSAGNVLRYERQCGGPRPEEVIDSFGGTRQMLVGDVSMVDSTGLLSGLNGVVHDGITAPLVTSAITQPITIDYAGCKATWTDKVTIRYVVDLPPGEYALAPNEFLLREFTFNTPKKLTYRRGAFPTIVVEP